MPPRANKRNNANQHDKRHESGLAAPGKRISKQRSNPSLNGQANGKAAAGVPPPPLPSTGLNQGLVFPRPANHSTGSAETISGTRGEDRIGGSSAAGSGGAGEAEESGPDKGRTSSRASIEDDMPTPISTQVDDSVSRMTRRVSEAHAYKSASSVSSSAGSALTMAATILSSCPLRDAIALLILLLSLPPALVIIINGLFASLTFVPPANASLSWTILAPVPPTGGWFHGTASGGPSLFTIVLADVVVLVIVLAGPLFAQSFVLDLCQAVVAISLSGATAETGGAANSVLISTAIVIITHLLRYNKLHLTALDFVRSVLHRMGTPIAWDPTSASTQLVSSTPSYNLLRKLLGCHILAQGGLTLLRRTLQSYASYQSTNTIQMGLDGELASYGENGRLPLSAGDGNAEPVGSLSSDGRPPGPSPAVREGEKRVSHNKRKRRMANQVRSQQPLWAAIGSTKVTFLREMEHKQATRDALEAEAANNTEPEGLVEEVSTDRIWIMDIRANEIIFRADMPTWADKNASTTVENGKQISAGIDKTKPFYVRMNGADWSSTRINGAAEGDADDKTTKLWNGEIYGLTPLTKYSCEFVCLSSQEVICSTSIVTLPAPSAEQASIVPPPQHQTLRPLSPVSTLKQSIAAAEVKRDEARNRLKRTRKDHKNAASAIRKEIEQLNGKVLSAGGQDERQRQRILQLTQHLRQANDAAVTLKDETDALGDIPEDELTEHNEKKRAWQAVRDKRAAALAEADAVKAEAQRELAQINSELSSTVQKRERLQARHGKLNEQVERLTVQQNANMTARQKHDHERATRIAEYQRQQEELQYWAAKSKQGAEQHILNTTQAYQQLDYVSKLIAQSQIAISRPPTPEGTLPGENGPQVRTNGFDMTMSNNFAGAGHSPHMGLRGGVRGRSSSMLSEYSGFTDDMEVAPGPEENKSEGSSGSSASPGGFMNRRPLVSKSVSPIGPPGGSAGASPKR